MSRDEFMWPELPSFESVVKQMLHPTRYLNKEFVPTGTLWSDRLYQWDYKKYNDLCRKHFGNEGQTNWDERDLNKIEQFLCDYLDKQVKLIKVEYGENIATGYPVYQFFFADNI